MLNAYASADLGLPFFSTLKEDDMQMNATAIAMGFHLNGDVEGLQTFLDGGVTPLKVANLPAEDNVFGAVWKTGEGFLRSVGRLQEAETGRALYRIVNPVQDSFRLPEFDELVDVRSVVVGPSGAPFTTLRRVDIEKAALGLGMPGLNAAARDEYVSWVFPYVYLKGTRRRVGLWWMVAGWFSKDVRAENRGIRLFTQKMVRLVAMYEAMYSSHRFACGGWFALLRDIVDGKRLEASADDCAEVKAAFTWVSCAEREYARKLLLHAEKVMSYTELRFDWPEAYSVSGPVRG